MLIRPILHPKVHRMVLLMWDRRVVEKVKEFIEEYMVACSFKRVENSFLWAFEGVYGLNENSNRHLLQK